MGQDTSKQTEAESEALQFQDFRIRNEPKLTTKLFWWLRDQTPLFEAFFVAVSIHVVAFPVIWFIGWALPWPKPPVVTTIMEIDLTDWPKGAAKPKRIFEFRDPKLNQ